MKKKIFNISLVLILTIAMLFTLTACGDDDDDEKDEKSSSKSATAEDVIESAVEAINNQEVDDLLDLIDLDALEEVYGETIKKKELKEGLKSFFKENDDFEVKLSKIQSLEDDEDLLDDLLDYYDSYDEYVEEIEDDYDLEDVYIYTAKVKLSGDYDDIMDLEDDDSAFKDKDVIYLIKKDKEYKIIYTRLAIMAYSQNIYGYDDFDYEYDDDDYDYDYDDDDDEFPDPSDFTTTSAAFNTKFESYDGSQTGSNVKKLVDEVIANNKADSDNHPVYISYYGKDGYIEEIMLLDTSELTTFKNKLEATHKYTVELDTDYSGYIRYIDITY